eukprot:scaffold48_cov311-Pinguiococcus_pyrenoidosus.AAC.344
MNDLDLLVTDVSAGTTYNAGPATFPDPNPDDGIYGPPPASHRPPSTRMADRDALNTIEVCASLTLMPCSVWSEAERLTKRGSPPENHRAQRACWEGVHRFRQGP